MLSSKIFQVTKDNFLNDSYNIFNNFQHNLVKWNAFKNEIVNTVK